MPLHKPANRHSFIFPLHHPQGYLYDGLIPHTVHTILPVRHVLIVINPVLSRGEASTGAPI